MYPHALSEELSALDALIRGAKMNEARTRLTAKTDKDCDRRELAALAWLSWRCDLPHIGLRLLAGIVRPPPKSPVQATASERAEYAACLIKIGAIHEGEMLLAKID